MDKLVGLGPFLLVEGPVILVAASIGVWIFYVQHQFERTRWEHDANWNFYEAALHGSSYYELPPLLAWFTGNIGVHHVHHLCSRIPFYRLSQVLDENPELASVSRLTFLQSLRSAKLALWDEDQQRLVSFSDIRASVSEISLVDRGKMISLPKWSGRRRDLTTISPYWRQNDQLPSKHAQSNK